MYNRKTFPFVTSCLAVVALLALPLVVGCGGDDDDPVPAACEAACKIDNTDVCYTQQTKCKSDCDGIGRSAQRDGYKPNECATCQVGQVSYSRAPDGSKCWGVIVPTDFKNATCSSVCIDPNI